MEDGRNECYAGRTWCTARTQWVPALRQESRFIATVSWGLSCQLPPLGRHLCHSSPRLSFSFHLALMECRYSPWYPCLYHRITWFQIKSMAPNFSSCGLTMAFTTFCTINNLRIFPFLQTESILRVGGCQSYQLCDPLGPISVLSTQELSKYLLY